MWLIIPFILVIILAYLGNIPLLHKSNRDIAILYKRTDKKTKEFENERQIRVKLQRRIAKLEHENRQIKNVLSTWKHILKNPQLRESVGKAFLEKKKVKE